MELVDAYRADEGERREFTELVNALETVGYRQVGDRCSGGT
jgi:hypothetical protein